MDPVCGMHLDRAIAPERRDTETGSYFFYSAQYAARFGTTPDQLTPRRR
ncbi:hypothetical protein ACFCX0_30890 [Streptomyces sp. NPDC056352]